MYKVSFENIIHIARSSEELFDCLYNRLLVINPGGEKHAKSIAFAVTEYMSKARRGEVFEDKAFKVEVIR